MLHDPLNQPSPTPALSLVSNTRVPNEFPTEVVPYKLAIVGEAPGADEEAYGRPFVGASGRLLDTVLSQCGVLRAGCFVGNICKYRPPGNEIKEFGYDHPKVLAGWEELKGELHDYAPNAIFALGNTPLHFLCNRTGILSWRGSILSSPYGKVIPAIHPAAILREYKQWFLLRLDAIRAREEAESPDIVLPKRNLELDLTANEICNRLDNWPTGRLLSFDIEGGLDAFPCCSVADSPGYGFIIAFSKFSEFEQQRIYVALSRILYSLAIPKVLQNSLYDRFVLAYGYNMLIRNVVEDTMDKQWAIYSELRKSLGTIASIWTREPYYKFERKTDDPRRFYEYCIKDSCVTLEASNAMEQALTPQEKKHYKFSVALKTPLLYMELRGFRYDNATVQLELSQTLTKLAECNSRLALQIQPTQWAKKQFDSNICGPKGSISSQRLAKVLYQQKSYPEQFKGRGTNRKTTTDVEALLHLVQKKEYRDDPFLADVLLHRSLESIRETLEWKVDPDGRIRCSYNQFSKGEDNNEEGGGATETGRLRCSRSITGSGGNLQAATKVKRMGNHRRHYLADDDHWMFQCDLQGADGWTVAAHCLRHGDSTMWDDYHFGLKPARIVALMHQHGAAVSNLSRDQLKELSKTIDDDGWLYFACKRIQHASNYGVGERTVSTQIMVDSYKITGQPVYLDSKTCAELQRLYFVRYPGLYQWHAWAKREVEAGHNITSASGHTRVFLGRRRSYNSKTRSVEADHETWKEFLADEPQENTTFATNLALYRMWHDPENFMDEPIRHTLPNGGRLCQWHRVDPMHQVHDAILGQFAKKDTDWAISRITTWFDNELHIASSKVKIPFEGKYGPSWGELGEKYGGGTF